MFGGYERKNLGALAGEVVDVEMVGVGLRDLGGRCRLVWRIV